MAGCSTAAWSANKKNSAVAVQNHSSANAPAHNSSKTDVDALIREKGLVQVTDEAPIRAAVEAVLGASPAQVEAYRGGKAASFGWFVGQVMKATAGKASPALVNRLLRERLDA